MKKLVIALSIIGACFIARADEEISYSLGLKGWNHQFEDNTTKLETTTSTLVSLTAKKGDYFVVAAFVLPTTYARDNQALIIRRDADLALGWSATSNVSFVIGQKD